MQHLVRLPLRGQRRLGSTRRVLPSCFPFDCAAVKGGTSTNADQCKRAWGDAYNPRRTTAEPHTMASIEELAERVERLLLRHEELQRTHTLTVQQLGAVSAERDSLKSRLAAARQRVDALLDRLPQSDPTAEAEDTHS